MKKININILAGYTMLLIIAVGTSIFGAYIVKKIQKEQSPQTTIKTEERLSQYPDYYAIKGKNPDSKIRAIRIASDCPSEGCINDNPATIEFGEIHKKYEVNGEFSRAYLYIESAVDYNRPLTAWDDFYFKINGLGGHLINDSNLLPVPPSDISIFLYDLRSISYFSSMEEKEQNLDKQLNINFFVLLQNGIILDITSAISSNRPGRIIKEVSIYYECFKGSECNIYEKK